MLVGPRHPGLHWLLIGWEPWADVWDLACDSGTHIHAQAKSPTHTITHAKAYTHFPWTNERLGWVLTGRQAHMLWGRDESRLSSGDYKLNKRTHTHTHTHINTRPCTHTHRVTSLRSQDRLTPRCWWLHQAAAAMISVMLIIAVRNEKTDASEREKVRGRDDMEVRIQRSRQAEWSHDNMSLDHKLHVAWCACESVYVCVCGGGVCVCVKVCVKFPPGL